MAADTHKRPGGRPRTASRVAAVQALFQGEQAEESVEVVIDQFVRHRLPATPGADPAEDYEAGRVPADDGARTGR